MTFCSRMRETKKLQLRPFGGRPPPVCDSLLWRITGLVALNIGLRSERQAGYRRPVQPPVPPNPPPDRGPQARRLKARRQQPSRRGSEKAAELGAEGCEQNFYCAKRCERDSSLTQPTFETLHRDVVNFHGHQRNAEAQKSQVGAHKVDV